MGWGGYLLLHFRQYNTGEKRLWQAKPGAWFHINMPSFQYRKSDKTILRPSYLHNGISYTGETTSLYWIKSLNENVCSYPVASGHKQPHPISKWKMSWLNTFSYCLTHNLVLNPSWQFCIPSGIWRANTILKYLNKQRLYRCLVRSHQSIWIWQHYRNVPGMNIYIIMHNMIK